MVTLSCVIWCCSTETTKKYWVKSQELVQPWEEKCVQRGFVLCPQLSLCSKTGWAGGEPGGFLDELRSQRAVQMCWCSTAIPWWRCGRSPFALHNRKHRGEGGVLTVQEQSKFEMSGAFLQGPETDIAQLLVGKIPPRSIRLQPPAHRQLFGLESLRVLSSAGAQPLLQCSVQCGLPQHS